MSKQHLTHKHTPFYNTLSRQLIFASQCWHYSQWWYGSKT